MTLALSLTGIGSSVHRKQASCTTYASNNNGPGENLQAWGEGGKARVDVIWHRSAPSIQLCKYTGNVPCPLPLPTAPCPASYPAEPCALSSPPLLLYSSHSHTPYPSITTMAGPPPKLYSFPDTDTLAGQFRSYVLRCQNHALNRHGNFRLAVSGGSLPTILAKALLTIGDGSSLENTPQFAKWDIFFADERAVPLDHPDSNFRLLKDELISKIPAQMGTPKVHCIDPNHVGDDDPQELADLYQEELMRVFAAKDSVKLPVFDLMLLGCGPDGHTCSLFPGHELLREKDAWVGAETESPKPPPKRITLTLPVVTHAINIAYVSTGGGKKDIMKQIFDAEEGRSLPSSLVNQLGGEKVSWFTDHAAVEGVAFPRRGSL
jgi:6-phosphogluconolactonase